jgi:hypothetical protein
VLAVMLMAAKYGLKVCPHAGGVGLCEYVQHLSMIDYLCIAGTKEGRVIEYVDHLHEHFVDPCVMRNAAYMPPKLPGFSIEMKRRGPSTSRPANFIELWTIECLRSSHAQVSPRQETVRLSADRRGNAAVDRHRICRRYRRERTPRRSRYRQLGLQDAALASQSRQ